VTVPPTCSVCASPERAAIERALVEGVAIRAVARQHDVGRDAVARHARNGHVPLDVKVGAGRRADLHAVDLTARAEELYDRARKILEDATGRPTVELAAVRELRAVVELLAKLTGVPAPDDAPARIILTLPGPTHSVGPTDDEPPPSGTNGNGDHG
jgi:hypothetical protein